MPKFKMEQSYLLHNLLSHMGITSVFSNSANLTKLSKDQGLKVSEVSVKFYHSITTYSISIFQPVQLILFLFFFLLITGAAQGFD